MPRYEYKYNISVQYLDSLRKDLMPYLIYDSFARQRANNDYTVHSLYLDSHKLLTFYEKLDGVRNRKKFRIRGYNQITPDSKVFLEIKRKDVEHIHKDRAVLKYSNLEKFFRTSDLSLLHTTGNNSSIKTENARKFLYYYHYHILQPAVLVNYEREAMECKFGSGLRLTLDKNVRAKNTTNFNELFSDDGFKNALKDHFVLEIKFHKILPNWLPRVLQKYNIIRMSSPKYAMSVLASGANKKLLKMR
ncbi:MAG: VTC domain protein [Ignavibacteria bacterium]|nr:MAG: VTC domain protein [Ignavibacteria bacterium]KAF0160967.1 MAG: VTC domain protein [Ignavibacteria bacterium]